MESSNIAVVSQQKYAFQRIACLWAALEHWDNLKTFLYEPKDGEDATLVVAQGDTETTIELQIKGSEANVRLEILCEWLAHFPEHKSDAPLAERIRADQNRRAMFIVSGRCSDDVEAFCVTTPKTVSNRGDVRVSKFKEAFKSVIDGETPLEKARATYRRNFFNANGSNVPWLERVAVIDRINSEIANDACATLLTKKLRIAEHLTRQVLTEACEFLVANCRTSQDLLPDLRNVLGRHSALRMFGQNNVYIQRGDEDVLRTCLDAEHILLLHGPPECGKTHTARWLSQALQDDGFHCKEFERMVDVRLFLLDATTEKRTALLHDPFGSIVTNADAREIKRLLERTIIDLEGRANRKLIVTSRSPIIQELASVADWALAGCCWRDLGIALSDRGDAIWREYATRYHCNPVQIEHVAAHLSGEWIEPGAWKRIASNLNGELPSKSRLLEIANFSGGDIGRALAAQPPKARVLSCLAATASSVRYVGPLHLAFVLAENKSVAPWYAPLAAASFLDKDCSFPVYETALTLAQEDIRILDELCEAGLLEAADGWRFTHPIYEQAAVVSLQRSTRALLLVEQALQCLSPEVALCALRRAEHLWSSDAARMQSIFELASASIFPAVAEGGIEMGLAIDGATNNATIKLLNAFSRRERLHWHEGVPWYKRRDGVTMYQLVLESLGPTEREIESARSALLGLSEGAVPSIQTQYLLLEEAIKLKQQPHQLILRSSATCEISLVRALLVEVLLADDLFDVAPPLRSLIRDSSATVIVYAIRTALTHWARYSEQVKNILVDELSDAIRACRGRVLVSQELGFYIKRAEVRGFDTFPWQLWLDLVAVLLGTGASASESDDHRIFRYVHKAAEYVDAFAICKFVDRWLEWIEVRVSHGRLVTDYAVSPAELLLTVTKDKPRLRACFLPRLLKRRETFLCATFIYDFVKAWDFLTDEERFSVEHVLRSDRTDICWLQATVLMGYSVPPRMLEILGVGTDFFTLSPAQMLVRLSDDMLRASIAVFCGRPYPLWSLAFNHRRAETWNAILIEVAQRPEHRLFQVALEELLRKPYLQSVVDVWGNLCAVATADLADLLFELLLKRAVCVVDANVDVLWRLLFSCAVARDRLPEWRNRIEQNLESIDCNDNLEALLRINAIAPATWKAVEKEMLWVRIARERSGAEIENVLKFFEKAQPGTWRMGETHDVIRELLKSMSRQPNKVDWYESSWKAYFAACHRQRSTMEDNSQIWNWT